MTQVRLKQPLIRLPATSPRHRWICRIGAGLIAAGLWSTIFFDHYDAALRLFFGLMTAVILTFFALLIYGVWRVVSAAVIYLSGGKERYANAIVLGVSCILCATIVILSWHSSRPINQFRARVMDPPPASLQSLQIDVIRTFGNGSMRVFRFTLSDADFEILRTARDLQPVSIDPEQQQKINQINNDPNYTDDVKANWMDILHAEDRPFRMALRDAYVRPTHPLYFEAGEISVVRDQITGATTLVVNGIKP